jgi:hypothetical protein
MQFHPKHLGQRDPLRTFARPLLKPPHVASAGVLVLQGGPSVRLVPSEDPQNTGHALRPTKTALKRESQGRKLVAGAGFEPATFRL